MAAPPTGDGFARNEHAALTASLRQLIDTVRVLDAPADELEAVQAQIDALSARLAPHRYRGPVAQGALDGTNVGLMSAFRGSPNEYFPYSPIVGPHNPLSPPVRMWADGGRMYGEVTVGAPYTGPPNLVHGGIIALIFDELLGSCAVENGCAGFTGTLTVKYRRGTPVFTPLALEAWLDRVDGRKSFVEGVIRNGDEVTAEASGIFISGAHQIAK